MSHTVVIEFEDETYELEVDEDEYILDAGLNSGLNLPFSCREGNCTTCTGELLDGEVDQSEGTALDKKDRKDGYVLLCSAYPQDKCHVQAGGKVQEDMLGIDIF